MWGKGEVGRPLLQLLLLLLLLLLVVVVMVVAGGAAADNGCAYCTAKWVPT